MPIIHFSRNSVNLNDEQYAVVTSPITENQRILASAGSGKTTTITARIAYLVEKYGIPAHKILLVTFSRAAAQEMIERVTRIAGHLPMYAGTFHGLSAQILREQTPASLRDQPFIDELPHRLVEWLSSDKGRAWVLRFRAIIVDEFQDINAIQWKLLEKIRHRGATMTIVGDDAQNIYTWRGSSVDFILHFHTLLGAPVKDYQLRRNYRSSEAIVACANSVMRYIPTLPYKEKMVAHSRNGVRPEVRFFFRGADEYDWIVRNIEDAYHNHTPQTFAVISRYNHDLFKIEERLHRKGIIYSLCSTFDPERNRTHQRRITLATIHASKGLEWDTVYFMNLHDDVFPSRKSDADIVCERRLFYVGITRARKELFLTYSRQERSLSRFVREIPRPFLTYYNVCGFKHSSQEGVSSLLSISDMITGFDGDDWHRLRQQSCVPSFHEVQKESIFSFAELFSVPDWVKTLDARQTWIDLVQWIFLRECVLQCSLRGTKDFSAAEQLRTLEVDETLLTLRIYKEDIQFWLQFETEMEQLVYAFLQHTQQMPAIEYHHIEAYAQKYLQHLEWTTQHIVQATIIIAKLRGQLRPLRHAGYDLTEFRFGYVRNSVPTEFRPDVLASWHRITSMNTPSKALMGDFWRLAALSSVVEGRNIPLYQYHEVLPFLEANDTITLVSAIEHAANTWIQQHDDIVFSASIEYPSIKPIRFHILTECAGYHLCFIPLQEPNNDDKIIAAMTQYVYEAIYNTRFEYIGFINLATGVVYRYKITDIIRWQTAHIWNALQIKYPSFTSVPVSDAASSLSV